jgi:predicted cobalt transporter CbtA
MRPREEQIMGRNAAIIIYVMALIGAVVGVDVLFFRHNFWARLVGNVGIVLLFAAFYLRFHHAFGGK